MCRELFCEILKGEELMKIIEELLIFTVASFNFAIVPGRVWFDVLVPDSKLLSGFLK